MDLDKFVQVAGDGLMVTEEGHSCKIVQKKSIRCWKVQVSCWICEKNFNDGWLTAIDSQPASFNHFSYNTDISYCMADADIVQLVNNLCSCWNKPMFHFQMLKFKNCLKSCQQITKYYGKVFETYKSLNSIK